jgi:hypothetical protein
MKDFKSIIYKRNQLGPKSLAALPGLLKKTVPFHLDELKLMDLKIKYNLVDELIKIISDEQCYLGRLALVNIRLSDFQMM